MSNLLFLTIAADLFDIQNLVTFAQQEFEREITLQINRDGTVFEASTYYHRLTLEIVFFTILFKLKMNSNTSSDISHLDAQKYFSNSVIKRLYGMFLFIRYTVKNDGTLPIVGDNDSGQILRVYDNEVLDVRYLLSLGSYFW